MPKAENQALAPKGEVWGGVSTPQWAWVGEGFLPRDALCALRGIATVSRHSVRPSVCPSVRDVDVPWAYVLS